mgnify:CR=1 FL=1
MRPSFFTAAGRLSTLSLKNNDRAFEEGIKRQKLSELLAMLPIEGKDSFATPLNKLVLHSDIMYISLFLRASIC